MKFYIGLTDTKWYNFLSAANPEDVNFWRPGGTGTFRVLPPGGPFLFKLKSPNNFIAGIGFFSGFMQLPITLAWDIFKERNGFNSFFEFKSAIQHYRSDKATDDPYIGCIVLTNPIFFKREDWIPVPDYWKKSIQQGVGYDINDPQQAILWNQVGEVMHKYLASEVSETNQLSITSTEPRYTTTLQKIRIGQGAFRLLVTDAYNKRCAISSERTLPVLEAAHIRSYRAEGPNLVSNSLLLRSDLHKLFDTGYLTITKDYKIEVSKRIKAEFENGRDYYKFHGGVLSNLPGDPVNRPNTDFIEWHNANVYNG